jgi:putative NADH-flavin reductase
MKLVVFGASRGVGRQVVEQALAAGLGVTAFARDPSALSPHQGLTILRGDALDAAAVAEAVRGRDAVVVALGAGNTGESRVRSQGTANVVWAMRSAGVKRLVAVSSFGVGDSRKGPIAAMAWLFLRKALEEHERQERIIKESGLDWTIVQPTRLVDESRTGKYHIGTYGRGKISRADVAEFILKALSDPSYVGKAVVLSS